MFNPKSRKKSPIYQYAITGEFIKGFRSVSEAVKSTGASAGAIGAAASEKHALQTANGFRWSKKKKLFVFVPKSRRRKPLNQFDTQGRLVQRFKSAQEASKAVGISHKGISDAAVGRIKTSGGFRWEFAAS